MENASVGKFFRKSEKVSNLKIKLSHCFKILLNVNNNLIQNIVHN